MITNRDNACNLRITDMTIALLSSAVMMAASPTHAQSTPSLVSACSGVRLNRSVVTNIMRPVVLGINNPIEDRINSILDVVRIIPIVGRDLGRIETDVSGLLDDAASGAPITLSVFDRNGNAIGPNDRCDLQADTLSLTNPRGLAIGGNRITGLGTGGAFATAGDVDAIAFGNGAATSLAAAASIAIGRDASVTVANSVALGAGSTAARGPQLSYTAFGLDDAQVSAGEVSVGAPGARRQITHLAAGSAPDDAVNVTQLQSVAEDVAAVAADVAALDQGAVHYDSAGRERITLGGAQGTVIANVTPGQIADGSAEAVNGGQLFDTNQQVAGLDARVSGHDGGITQNSDAISAHAESLADHETRITFLESQVPPGGGSPPPPTPLRYADAATPTIPNGGTVTDDAVLVGASGGPVRVRNVDAATLATGSTDAVNGGQLHDTNQVVGGHTIAIANITNDMDQLNLAIANLGLQIEDNRIAISNLTTLVNNQGGAGAGAPAGPLRYSEAETPAVPNGGAPSDHATLVGASGGPVQVHNVAPGVVAAGSTDAVNGGQLHSTNQAVAVALATADEAVALGRNSVQYDADRTAVTFAAGDAMPPVLLRNVAAGVAATDAVNLGQLDAGLQGAVGQANAYTDLRIEALNRDLGGLRRDSNAGIANALAAAALPQASDPGRGMLSGGTAYFQGQAAIALGLSARTDDGRAVFRAGASVDTRGRAGVNAGAGIQF